jgi:methionyl-tRNA formyltransferase
MNTIIATNKGSLYGKKLINEFILRGIETKAVTVIEQPLSYYKKLFKYVKGSVGFSDGVYFLMRRIAETERAPRIWKGTRFIKKYEDMGIPIVYTTGTNSHQTQEILKAYRPDILILGQTGIVQREILRIPRLGTLNAHPGILPYYRGIDCEKWAIYQNEPDKVGCSVHWVDPGVDTGGIIARERYVIKANDTLRTLTGNLYDLAARMLADVVLGFAEGKSLDIISQDGSDGTQYRKMARWQEGIVREKLRALKRQIQATTFSPRECTNVQTRTARRGR